MVSELHVLIAFLFKILWGLLYARIIFSWIPSAPGDVLYDIAIFVFEVTEPLCMPFRKLIPPIGCIDISIIFVFIFLSVFEQFVFTTLMRT